MEARLQSEVKSDIKVRKSKTCFGGSAFSVGGPRCWNNNPTSIKSASTLESSKYRLKHTTSRNHISGMRGVFSRHLCNGMCCIMAPSKLSYSSSSYAKDSFCQSYSGISGNNYEFCTCENIHFITTFSFSSYLGVL